jgi:hypothetical protein
LKNIHIESIESLLKRKDEENDKLSHELLQLQSLVGGDNNNNYNNSYNKQITEDHFKSTFGSKNTFNTEEKEQNFIQTVQSGTIYSHSSNNNNLSSLNNLNNEYHSHSHSQCQCTPGVIVTSRFNNEIINNQSQEKGGITSGFSRNEESEKELKKLINQYQYNSKESEINTQECEETSVHNQNQNHSRNQSFKNFGMIIKSGSNHSLNKISELNNSVSSQGNVFVNKTERIPGKIYSLKK